MVGEVRAVWGIKQGLPSAHLWFWWAKLGQQKRQTDQARAANEGVVAMRGPQGQMMLGDGRAETAEVPIGVMEKRIFQ